MNRNDLEGLLIASGIDDCWLTKKTEILKLAIHPAGAFINDKLCIQTVVPIFQHATVTQLL